MYGEKADMNDNYHIIRIQQYLNGTLSREEMHQMEREALEDPLLNDAIEGYRLQNKVDHGRLSLLQQRLAARIEGQQQERHTFYFGWQRLGVAATACVLMVLVLVLLWMRSHTTHTTPTEKEVVVELTAPETIAGIHAEPVMGKGLDAYPGTGWEQFNTYLAENKDNLPIAGKLVVTFDVDPTGKPTAVRTLDGANASLLAKVQRLLQEGPLWKGTKGKLTISVD